MGFGPFLKSRNMPLYMDLHHIDPDITQEDLLAAHMKDIEVQDKYGLEHKKYYVNFEEKTVFCLINAPDKQCLHNSHAEVHGVGPCNIIEVSSLTPTFDFNTMIGEEGGKNEWDVALTRSGEIDTGYRSLLLTSLYDFTGTHEEAQRVLFNMIERYDGRIVMQPDEKIMASFLHAQDAVFCGQSMASYLQATDPSMEFCIGIVTGKPVDETGSLLFQEAVERLKNLVLLGSTGKIYLDAFTQQLFEKGRDPSDSNEGGRTRLVSPDEIHLFGKLSRILRENLRNSGFSSEELGSMLGLSRAQAYRRIKSLTGMSPNVLIREYRLRRSLPELLRKDQTVAQVSYEVGFNSPTYFTRMFRKRYGILPTAFSKLAS